MHLAGGLVGHGHQCGQIWGAVLGSGAQAYRQFGAGPLAEVLSIRAARRLVADFRARNREIDCLKLTDVTRRKTTFQMIRYFLTGGPIRCLRMAAAYAPGALTQIDSALSEKQVEALGPPVSCTAVLAAKMGASALHAVMVSGLAGGIGLCGGACGALGAAIWIRSMAIQNDGHQKIGFADPGIAAVMERFLNQTDGAVTCARISGHQFDSVGRHAEFVRLGGCASLIELLVDV